MWSVRVEEVQKYAYVQARCILCDCMSHMTANVQYELSLPFCVCVLRGAMIVGGTLELGVCVCVCVCQAGITD